MSYVQVNLPAPAANGSGAAVSVAAFGATKTITVSAGNGVSPPSVIIEVSNQSSPTKWAPLAFFQGGGDVTVDVACRWMRATVTNYTDGSAPTVDVGGQDDGTSFATLVAPAGSGNGAGVDTGTLGPFKTVHVAGPFQGACNIEISQDDGVTYQQALSFLSGQSGVQSAVFVADKMRVSRNGVPESEPGTPIVNIGATDSGGGGGGGGGGNEQSFEVELEGSEGDEFTINLPSARAATPYNVQMTVGGPSANTLMAYKVLTDTRTSVSFDVQLGRDAAAGDVLMFVVKDLDPA